MDKIRDDISDEVWKKIEANMVKKEGNSGGRKANDKRTYINGCFGVLCENGIWGKVVSIFRISPIILYEFFPFVYINIHIAFFPQYM